MLNNSFTRGIQVPYLQLACRIVEQTEDVGERFAKEARKIHYGEAQERGIRGQASSAQTREVLKEGHDPAPTLAGRLAGAIAAGPIGTENERPIRRAFSF